MRYEAVIFDFDGVIVDSEVAINQAIADLLTECGMPTTLDEAIERYCGRSTEATNQAIETHWKRPLPSDFRERLGVAVAPILDAIPAVAGAASFIAGLPSVPRAVASSSSLRWINGHLERLDLAHHFNGHVYSGRDHVARHKPAPDIYLHAASSIGADPVRTVVIEDSVMGVRAGVAAGMTVIGLCAGGHARPGMAEGLQGAGAHHVALSYGEVAALIA